MINRELHVLLGVLAAIARERIERTATAGILEEHGGNRRWYLVLDDETHTRRDTFERKGVLSGFLGNL